MSEQPFASSSARVPDELMAQLHRANERLHDSRLHLEQAMDSVEFRHQERISHAEQELREAQRQLEEVEQQIRQKLAEA